QQVQVVWLKNALNAPPSNFPISAQTLQQDLGLIVQNLKTFFPNLAICYISSRTYGGYATTATNPEPQAYESGFSVKWMIEDQINGSPDLNYDPDKGPVMAPLLLWGPYLWANGMIPRSDGLVWLREDFEPDDGTHPTDSGQTKVANML